MRAHTLESNFAFIKGLSNSKELGYSKLKSCDVVFEKEKNLFYRSIYFKKAADLYKIGYVTSGRLYITEFEKGIFKETIKIKIK
jgi:hypothetical protein